MIHMPIAESLKSGLGSSLILLLVIKLRTSRFMWPIHLTRSKLQLNTSMVLVNLTCIRCLLIVKVIYVVYLICPAYENFNKPLPPFKFDEKLSVRVIPYERLKDECELLER